VGAWWSWIDGAAFWEAGLVSGHGSKRDLLAPPGCLLVCLGALQWVSTLHFFVGWLAEGSSHTLSCSIPMIIRLETQAPAHRCTVVLAIVQRL